MILSTISIYGEQLVKEFTYKNIPFEVVSCPSTIWWCLGGSQECWLSSGS